jgi:hypothetical protein
MAEFFRNMNTGLFSVWIAMAKAAFNKKKASRNTPTNAQLLLVYFWNNKNAR